MRKLNSSVSGDLINAKNSSSSVRVFEELKLDSFNETAHHHQERFVCLRHAGPPVGQQQQRTQIEGKRDAIMIERRHHLPPPTVASSQDL